MAAEPISVQPCFDGHDPSIASSNCRRQQALHPTTPSSVFSGQQLHHRRSRATDRPRAASITDSSQRPRPNGRHSHEHHAQSHGQAMIGDNMLLKI
ncbi:hypothetical protein ACLOJK_014616 [Asimina triloba]